MFLATPPQTAIDKTVTVTYNAYKRFSMNDAYKIEYSTVDKSKRLAIPMAIVGAWALVQTIFLLRLER